MNSPIPMLETERLRLRPFSLGDAPAVHTLAGAPEVAATTLHIPHPYPLGAAEEWIGTHAGAPRVAMGLCGRSSAPRIGRCWAASRSP